MRSHISYAQRTPTVINKSPSGHNFYIRNNVKKLYLNLLHQVYVNYTLKMFKGKLNSG